MEHGIGRDTDDVVRTVELEVWAAAYRWMAVITISRDFSSAFSLACSAAFSFGPLVSSAGQPVKVTITN